VTAPTQNARQADLGTVASGPAIEHTFHIVNSSDHPFRVLQVRRSCACQAVAADKDSEVLPGSSAEIRVEVPTEGIDGPIAERFVVITSSEAPELTSVVLTLRANIVARIKAIPSQIVFGNIGSGESGRRQLQVRVSEPELTESFLSATVTGDPSLTVQLREQTLGLLSFDVELDPGIPSGDVTGRILLEFKDPHVPKIEVPVVGRKTGDLKVIPRQLMVASGSAFPQSRNLRLLSRARHEFQILAVEPPAGVKVDWDDQRRSASSFDLRVELTREPATRTTPFLIIRTDRPDQDLVKVAIVAENTYP
jgi:hypothetical protein